MYLRPFARILAKKGRALASILLRDCAINVHWKALQTYVEREKLYDIAADAPCTPMRRTGAPPTPTGAPIQTSPIRASPRRVVHAKLGDLPRYRNRVDEAIKANPGKRKRARSAVLKADYALDVHYPALKTYCDDQDLWGIKPDAVTPSRVLAGKRKICLLYTSPSPRDS